MNYPLYLSVLSIFLASLSLTVSCVVYLRGTGKSVEKRSERRFMNVQDSLTELESSYARLHKMLRGMIARENASQRKNSGSFSKTKLSDDEWRREATKRIQLGQPID